MLHHDDGVEAGALELPFSATMVFQSDVDSECDLDSEPRTSRFSSSADTVIWEPQEPSSPGADTLFDQDPRWEDQVPENGAVVPGGAEFDFAIADELDSCLPAADAQAVKGSPKSSWTMERLLVAAARLPDSSKDHVPTVLDGCPEMPLGASAASTKILHCSGSALHHPSEVSTEMGSARNSTSASLNTSVEHPWTSAPEVDMTSDLKNVALHLSSITSGARHLESKQLEEVVEIQNNLIAKLLSRCEALDTDVFVLREQLITVTPDAPTTAASGNVVICEQCVTAKTRIEELQKALGSRKRQVIVPRPCRQCALGAVKIAELRVELAAVRKELATLRSSSRKAGAALPPRRSVSPRTQSPAASCTRALEGTPVCDRDAQSSDAAFVGRSCCRSPRPQRKKTAVQRARSACEWTDAKECELFTPNASPAAIADLVPSYSEQESKVADGRMHVHDDADPASSLALVPLGTAVPRGMSERPRLMLVDKDTSPQPSARTAKGHGQALFGPVAAALSQSSPKQSCARSVSPGSPPMPVRVHAASVQAVFQSPRTQSPFPLAVSVQGPLHEKVIPGALVPISSQAGSPRVGVGPVPGTDMRSVTPPLSRSRAVRAEPSDRPAVEDVEVEILPLSLQSAPLVQQSAGTRPVIPVEVVGRSSGSRPSESPAVVTQRITVGSAVSSSDGSQQGNSFKHQSCPSWSISGPPSCNRGFVFHGHPPPAASAQRQMVYA